MWFAKGQKVTNKDLVYALYLHFFHWSRDKIRDKKTRDRYIHKDKEEEQYIITLKLQSLELYIAGK